MSTPLNIHHLRPPGYFDMVINFEVLTKLSAFVAAYPYATPNMKVQMESDRDFMEYFRASPSIVTSMPAENKIYVKIQAFIRLYPYASPAVKDEIDADEHFKSYRAWHPTVFPWVNHTLR